MHCPPTRPSESTIWHLRPDHTRFECGESPTGPAPTISDIGSDRRALVFCAVGMGSASACIRCTWLVLTTVDKPKIQKRPRAGNDNTARGVDERPHARSARAGARVVRRGRVDLLRRHSRAMLRICWLMSLRRAPDAKACSCDLM